MFEQRDYQDDDVNYAMDHGPDLTPVHCIATGGGKTVCQGMIAKREMDRGNNTAILTPRVEIFDQTHAVVNELVGLGNVATLKSGAEWRPYLPVHVVSWDTLIARIKRDKFWYPDVKRLIVDEAHLSLSPLKHKVLEVYRDRGILIDGYTATPARKSGKGLGDFYTNIKNVISIRQLIKRGYLAPCEYWGGRQADLTGVHIRQGDYAVAELSTASQPLIGDVIDNWGRLASDRHTIVFAVDVPHCEALAERFQQAGVRAAALHIHKTPARRTEIVEKFKSGAIQVLVNVSICSYGFDAPSVDCVVLARPTKSVVLWCLDTETEILTKNGWRDCDSIKDTDECAAFNMETEAIEWCEIQERVDRPIAQQESMMCYESHNASIRVTDMHDLVVKARRAKSWKKEPISKTKERKDMSVIPVAGFENIPDANITDDELRFLGWVLSDGTIAKYRVRIYQSEKHVEYCRHIESVLNACGFSWSRVAISNDNEFGLGMDYANRCMYSISTGQPRDGGKGCGHLSEWLDKSIPEIYDTLSRRQFSILLETLFLGDGSKIPESRYKAKTIQITMGDNELAADRLQAIAVVRGYRCNKSEHNYNKRPLFNLRFRDNNKITIAGLSYSDGTISGKEYKRSKIHVSNKKEGERVWCVQNRLGTLVTRRKGKVAVVGNCQMIGRGMRPAPDKEFCIAKGQRVLTDHGFIPIETVTTAMKVWDGVEFVYHDGVESRGTKRVITYAGVTATPDHEVWTKTGWRTLGACAYEGAEIQVTGDGRETIRQADSCFRRGAPQGEEQSRACSGPLHRLQRRVSERLGKFNARHGGVQKMRSFAWEPCASLAVSALQLCERALHKPTNETICGLWWSRHQIPVCVTAGNGGMDQGDAWPVQKFADRPKRQQRPLPAGQYTVVNAEAESEQQAEVFDIVNAGPRHRFTVEGLLVSNCLVIDHTGGVRDRDLGYAEELRRWRLDIRKPASTNWSRDERNKAKKKDEEKTHECEQCHHIFSRSLVCPKCGTEIPLPKRDIEATDEDLVRISKRQKDGLPKDWPDNKTFFLMLRHIQERSGYKLGWALYKYEEKIKTLPPKEWNFGPTMVPSVRVANWVRSRAIAYARSQKRKKEASAA